MKTVGTVAKFKERGSGAYQNQISYNIVWDLTMKVTFY